MNRRRTRKLTLTIPINSTTSDPVWVGEWSVRVVEMPAAITGSNPTVALQNAAVSDQSGDNPAPETYFAMVDGNGVPVALSVQVSKHVVLTGNELAAMEGAHWIRFVASASQAAARTFYLIGTQGD